MAPTPHAHLVLLPFAQLMPVADAPVGRLPSRRLFAAV
jgi:hypothetical protein